ncbi:MAG TPA: thermonuclease family protein [Vicinamibacterales bacterium]|nr:thermonuclease family protein [Vicinamibacterales bacterium]
MRSDPVLVRAVVDGNTIDVATVGHVRLLGIDAPALGRGSRSAAPFGKEARDRLASIVVNRWIRLEHEAGGGRAAYVLTENGVFVNALMVREGLARVSARASLARFDELKNAESEAQLTRRGMWSGSAQVPSPSYTRPSSRSSTIKKKKQ